MCHDGYPATAHAIMGESGDGSDDDASAIRTIDGEMGYDNDGGAYVEVLCVCPCFPSIPSVPSFTLAAQDITALECQLGSKISIHSLMPSRPPRDSREKLPELKVKL
jgi:hypothetical protein